MSSIMEFELSGWAGSSFLYVSALLTAATGVGALGYARARLSAGMRALAATVSVIGVTMLALGVALGYAGHTINAIRLRASADELTIDGGLYGDTFRTDALDLASARRVDFVGSDASLRSARRTNGIELAGLDYGWYELANGERALVALSDPSTAVYIPTRRGHALIVSPDDPTGLLEALRAAG